MKATITIEDLNAALALPWGTSTCIIAQFAKRMLKQEVASSSGSSILTKENKRYFISPKQYQLVDAFDDAHKTNGTRAYSLVESRLPVEVNIEEAN